MSDDIILRGLTYERGQDGRWYEQEPTGDNDGGYWVGPPLDDPQLEAALDEIERLHNARMVVLPDGYVATYATEHANGTIQLTCKPDPDYGGT